MVRLVPQLGVSGTTCTTLYGRPGANRLRAFRILSVPPVTFQAHCAHEPAISSRETTEPRSDTQGAGLRRDTGKVTLRAAP